MPTLAGARARLSRMARRAVYAAGLADNPLEPGAVLPIEGDARVIRDEPSQHFLWLDRRTFSRRIARARRKGRIDATEAALLTQWAAEGYLVIEGCINPALIDAALRDVDRAWSERWHVSVDLLTGSVGNTFLDRCEPGARNAPTKVNQLHLKSAAVRRLFLHERIIRIAEIIFGAEVVGVNSLTFDYGSQQTAHVDHVYMTPSPPRRVLASWIALEDVAADSGPLEFWPGSHRLPPFKWSNPYPYHYIPEEQSDHAGYLASQLHRFPRREFLAKKGDVLLWHAMLAHGGSTIKTPSRTRRSMACHYFSRECFPSLDVLERHEIAWTTRIPIADPD